MGFEEIPHTADWAVRVWAADLGGLFAEAAHAMYALSGVQVTGGGRVQRTFTAEGTDPESLLVAFLSELLYRLEHEGLAFSEFDGGITGVGLSLTMEGAPITSVEKAIKAVTWHDLRIEKTARGVETTIVFDV